ncbi:MAG: 3-oxoadipyl-CoA thiolase [Cellvibrionales bacterium]|nr:3-oxoadipyl-CoA thiolase [Porticoccaceae bacterium]|tara:strand:+ start:24448 stop:25653 length:1206 start_codon:yes stop_codon:yes gene_type:complete
MTPAYICDAIRTPIGRYGGSLASIRADDLAALPIAALIARNPNVDWRAVDDLIYGCANQAGEDNRNVARMAALLAGLPVEVAATTVNRLCGSGMDAVSIAARAIKAGEAHMMIAGGVESMSRAPLVMGKAEGAFGRNQTLYDTTMGWRFINQKLAEQYGVESMPETAENVAEQFSIGREDQDKYARASQGRAAAAQASGFFADEILPVTLIQRKKPPRVFDNDEHLRADTTLEGLAKLRSPFRPGGSVTAGNASGINDGSCALLLASESAMAAHNLTARARIVATAVVGLEPRIMGCGPAMAVPKVLSLAGLSLAEMDVIELNEAFAAQVLAVTRALDLDDLDPRINPNGGAIALGHPLGMSGARLVTTAINQLHKTGGKYAICSMCIGVGQGIAMIVERV